MKVLIGSAWPYANGLHIGHLAALLPADVLARYHRQRGDEVYFVSGSDCHGTPVTIQAKREGSTPWAVSEHYHREFVDCFERLGFSYDYYGKTSEASHKAFVQDFHAAMYQGGLVYEGEGLQFYCTECQQFLADRYVVGQCPSCGKDARGDQCDACGAVLEPEQLLAPHCEVCGGTPVLKPSKHLFLALSRLEGDLRRWAEGEKGWRRNAVNLTQRYLAEGLPDRAITRDLAWGIPVPRAGYEDKTIYIWAENVLGYLSASKVAAARRGTDFNALWQDDSARHYYVHGKDNVPFHSIILPALLLAHGGKWHLPDRIISSEHLTLEGRKISASQNWAIWVKDMLDRYQPDAIRYFLLANGPEKRDHDFSRRVFALSINGELLGVYGNFVNRTLAFLYKYMEGVVPAAQETPFDEVMASLYETVGAMLEEGRFKDALEQVFTLLRSANKYYDAEMPWQTRKDNPEACASTIYTCIQITANVCTWLAPFLPFSSAKVLAWLGLADSWQFKKVSAGTVIPQPEILFTRLEG